MPQQRLTISHCIFVQLQPGLPALSIAGMGDKEVHVTGNAIYLEVALWSWRRRLALAWYLTKIIMRRRLPAAPAHSVSFGSLP
jgi:hypothetical protein